MKSKENVTNEKKLHLGNFKKIAGKAMSEYIFVVIFLVILLAYLIIARGGITYNGIMNIFRHSAVVGVMALGMGIVIITRGIDLSVGSMLALVGIIAIIVFNSTGSILLTVLTCIVCGALCGFINGILIGKAKLPPFIVTLASMLIFRSLAQYTCRIITGTNQISLDNALPGRDALFNFGNSFVLTIPITGIVLIVVTIIMVIVTTKTKFGKSIYAVGSNEKAARLAGINADWLIVSMYLITGLLVGVAAFLWIAMNAAVDPATLGTSNEMYAIAAVVIGGISMSGGKGKLAGILFGAMSYSIIDKIITILGVDTLINNTIKGLILLLAIAAQITIPIIKNKIETSKKRKKIAELAIESEKDSIS